MMTPGQADIWTAPDGSPLGRMRWLPKTVPPRARVVAMHGLNCRREDIAPVGECLSSRGIAVEAWNLRGQGLDPQLRRRGAWLEVEGMLADLEAFAGEATEVPLFLCGDSMGALLAIQAASRSPWRERLAGLLLFVPVVGLAQKNPAWVKSVLKALAGAFPKLRLDPSWFVQGSAATPQLTRIPERQLAVETAPYRLGPTTLGFLASMGDLIEAALPAAPQLQTPVALFTAGHDVFVTPEQQREFFERIGAEEKTHFHYPESYHQLLFDLDADAVLADAAGWIEARLATRTSPR
jgi:alpha-beta hydrolase superfamily lysophospholipase